jgi:hypothetical protein
MKVPVAGASILGPEGQCVRDVFDFGIIKRVMILAHQESTPTDASNSPKEIMASFDATGDIQST